MYSNFECKLHNSITIKEFTNHILQCSFDFYIFLLQYTYGRIWYIINYFTTSFTLLFCWKMTVIDECVFCKFFQNRGIDSIDAYINTIINYQENSHSTYFFQSMFNTCAMVITDDTHSHFSKSFKCVSFTILGGHSLYYYNLSIPPLFLGQN